MLGSQDGANAVLPFKKDDVFNAILTVAEKMKGIKVKDSDNMLGRINLSTGASATSWGEAIPIQLIEDGEKTQISITSKSKTGVMAGGAFTKKNEQNVETLLSNISKYLQGNEISERGGSSKSLTVTLLLCIFLGWLGIHRYYIGKTGSGILYMFTLGVFGLGILIDAIRLIMGNFTDKNGDYISNW